MNNSPSNFGRLVLVCIKADFCDQILILQHFSRSTRFANLCTATNSKFSRFFNFSQKFAIFSRFLQNFAEFCHFSFGFSRKFAGISQNFSNFDFAIAKFQKTCQNPEKNAEKNCIFQAGWLFPKRPLPPVESYLHPLNSPDLSLHSSSVLPLRPRSGRTLDD